MERTRKLVAQIYPEIKNEPGVANVMSIVGHSILGGGGENVGFSVIVLEPWDKRTDPNLHSTAIMNRIKAKLSGIPSADINFFELPAIPGLGSSGGMDYRLQSLDSTDAYEAIRNIHFPKNPELLRKAQYRLKFEELFYVQLNILRYSKDRQRKYRGLRFERVGEIFNTFYSQNLPFELTGAQKRVIKEIRKDMGSGRQMNRLLQGDVGSGKTLVALMSMLIALDNGYQACMMAPTEILAAQHYETIRKFLFGMDVRVELLMGSVKGKKREKILKDLLTGDVQILIGTHAVLEDTVGFSSLGMVIIDEQHRFGVAQRAKLWSKNVCPPHVLVMTATPIPRTLAMTLYGDLDVSVIDELPPGRKPIQTIHQFDNRRASLYASIRKQIEEGRQIYIVYPLIKESEKMDIKNLEEGYELICAEFPDCQVSKVHGKMKPAEKDAEMQRFVSGETQIMVATTVIEVGVNVPNASVMVIENAERFGLSQLKTGTASSAGSPSRRRRPRSTASIASRAKTSPCSTGRTTRSRPCSHRRASTPTAAGRTCTTATGRSSVRSGRRAA